MDRKTLLTEGYLRSTPQRQIIQSHEESIQPEETVGSNFIYRIVNNGYVEGVGMNRCFHMALFQGDDNALKRYFNDPSCSFPKTDLDLVTNVASNPAHRKSIRDYVEKNNVCVEIYTNYGGKVCLVERFSPGYYKKDDKKKKILIFSFGEHFEQMVASNHPNATKYTLQSINRASGPETMLSPEAIKEINKDIDRAADAQNPNIQRALEASMEHTELIQDQGIQKALNESRKLAEAQDSQVQRALVESRKLADAKDSHVQRALVESRKHEDAKDTHVQRALAESRELAYTEECKRIQRERITIDNKKQQDIKMKEAVKLLAASAVFQQRIRDDSQCQRNDARLARSLAENYKKEDEQCFRDERYAQQLSSQYEIDAKRLTANAEYAKNLFID